MKEHSISINGADLLDRIAEHSHRPWWVVMDWPDAKLRNALRLLDRDIMWDPDQRSLALETIAIENAAARQEVRARWFVVTWPERCLDAYYFTDEATYTPALSEEDAAGDAQSVVPHQP